MLAYIYAELLKIRNCIYIYDLCKAWHTVHQTKLDMAHIPSDHDNPQMILSQSIKDHVACSVQPDKHAYKNNLNQIYR